MNSNSALETTLITDIELVKMDCPGGNLTTVYLKNGSQWNLNAFLSVVFMGPSRIPMEDLLPITVLYILLIVLGLAGNVITFGVIIRNSSMHTATNFYLLSMAFSDFIFILLGLYFLNRFIFYINTFYSFLLNLSGASSNLHTSHWHRYPFSMGEISCKLFPFLVEVYVQ